MNNTISGYRFGPYWFPVRKDRKQPIKGLCNCGFSDETDLCAAYDNTGSGGGLWRVYSDGTEVELRPPYTGDK